MKKSEIAYNNYKQEAEEQFLTVFMDSPKIKEGIMNALNVVLNLDEEPLRKGLRLFSKSYGQGKTLFFEIVYSRILRITKIKNWKKTTAKELREIYNKEGQEGLKNFISCKNLCIDDLGDEEEKTKHYGDDMNVLRYVILKRYEMWTEKGYLTHLTTNLNENEIAERYEGRVADRLAEMTELVEFDFLEGSFRQVTTTRRLTAEEKKKYKIPEVDKKNNDKDFFEYLEAEASDLRAGKLQERHWIDYWVIYVFFERKGLKMRDPNDKDKEKATAILKTERNAEIDKMPLADIRNVIHKKKPLDIDNVVLSIIGKEYFTKLALEKQKFSEANNLSEL